MEISDLLFEDLIEEIVPEIQNNFLWKIFIYILYIYKLFFFFFPLNVINYWLICFKYIYNKTGF